MSSDKLAQARAKCAAVAVYMADRDDVRAAASLKAGLKLLEELQSELAKHEAEKQAGPVAGQAPAPAPELDVRRIMLGAVPGEDGMGEEVYAKSVADVEAVLTRMGERIEELESRTQAPPSPLAEQAGTAVKPPKHKFWGAGEADCPADLKAPNGELHSRRCKVCGKTNPRDQYCWNAAPLKEQDKEDAEMLLLLRRLVDQIDKSEFIEENGHRLKMNAAYLAAKEAL